MFEKKFINSFIHLLGLRSGKPSKKADFTVDTRDAGYGGLGLSVEGPSKVEINCVDNEDGTCSVDYVPTEPGTYLINVTYADCHVPGSPFKCRISPDGLPIDEDEIVAMMDDGLESGVGEFSDMLAFPSSKARSPQDFVIKFSGTGDLKASVTRPSGIEDDAEVVETGPDTYTVRFVPRETGEHLVNVKSKRRHIPGSPFKVCWVFRFYDKPFFTWHFIHVLSVNAIFKNILRCLLD